VNSQASSIYFMPIANNLSVETVLRTRGCAIKLTQSGFAVKGEGSSTLSTLDLTKEKTPQTASGRPSAPSAKRPYQKSSFRFESMFETMALTCGKVAGTQGQCRLNRKLS